MVDERVGLSLRSRFQIFQLVAFPLFEILNPVHVLKTSFFIVAFSQGQMKVIQNLPFSIYLIKY